MKRIGTSVMLALLFVGVLGFTAFSQQAKDDAADEVVVQILEGGISQELPIDITLLLSTTTGVQTVTVPLKLNINLSVGPIDAVDLSVEVQNASAFVSPISVVEPMEEMEMEETEDEESEDATGETDEDSEDAEEDADAESSDG